MDCRVLYVFLAVSIIVVGPVSTLRERPLKSRHSAANKKIAKSLHRPINFRNFYKLGKDNLKALGFNDEELTGKEQLKTRKRRADSESTAESDNRQQNFLETFSNHISSYIVDPVVDQLDNLHLEAQLKKIINDLENSGSSSNDLPSETEGDDQAEKNVADASIEGLGKTEHNSPKTDVLPELGISSSEEEVEELKPTFVLPQEEGVQLHVVEDPITDNNGFFRGDGSGSGDNGFLDEGSGFSDVIFTMTEDIKDKTGDEITQSMLGDSQIDWSPPPKINGLHEQLLSIKEQDNNVNVQSESMEVLNGLPPDDDDMTETGRDGAEGVSGFENQLLDLISEERENEKTDEDEALRNFLLPFSMEYMMISHLMDEGDQIKDAEMKEANSNKEDAKAPQQSSFVTTPSGDLSKEEEMEIASDGLLIDDQGDKQHQLKALTTCLSVTGNEIIILPEDLCDGTRDCIGGEDENHARCERACSPGYSKCDDGLQCLKDNLFCNGIHQCHDRSDESDCERSMTDCEKYGMFSCDGVCRLKSFLCDHTPDCSDDVDELGCSYEMFSCPDGFTFDDVKLQCVYHV